MGQLKMFAPSQRVCEECHAKFIAMSKDMVKIWESELDLEPDFLTSRGWARERIYQEMLKCCSASCATILANREVEFESLQARLRLDRRYR